MRKILCCSIQYNFQNDLSSVMDPFKRFQEADEIIFRTIVVDQKKSDVDWDKMKDEGVIAVVFCDDLHSTILNLFFREVLSAGLPVYWYGRVEGNPYIIELKILQRSPQPIIDGDAEIHFDGRHFESRNRP